MARLQCSILWYICTSKSADRIETHAMRVPPNSAGSKTMTIITVAMHFLHINWP